MNYHYSRKNFAEKIIKKLSEFENASVFSYMLFEGRRKGKTTFLLKDIKPLAEKDFYVFYFSFMNQESDVIESFKKSLKLFFKEAILPQRQLGFSVNVGFLKVDGKTELKEPDSITEIFQMIKLYSEKPVLFLFDEFQEIGRSEAKNKEEFIMTLRTVLDQNREFFKSIFTGSSFNDINTMFNNYSQPFYKFGPQIRLNSLPDDFVFEICKNFQEEYQVKIKDEDIKELLKIFNENDRLPFIVIEIIQELEFFGDEYNFDIKTAYEKVKTKHLSLLKNDVYAKLNSLDKIILKWILIKGNKISSKETICWIEQNIEEKTYKVNRGTVLASLNKMKELNIIQRTKSNWKILNTDIYNIIAEKI